MRPDDDAEAGTSIASRLANAASFSFTSPVHSFRSRRNALRSRELSRICAWRFTDIRDDRDDRDGAPPGRARRCARRRRAVNDKSERRSMRETRGFILESIMWNFPHTRVLNDET